MGLDPQESLHKGGCDLQSKLASVGRVWKLLPNGNMVVVLQMFQFFKKS